VSTVHQELAERIRGELVDLAAAIQRAMRSWERGGRVPDEQDVYLESVALNLHAFYSGIERLFELIARHVDGALPAGEGWHHDLLRQMANELAEVRPAIISHETAVTLDEFRRFRHLVRNVYAFNLVPQKMNPLMDALPGLWQQLQAELSAFAGFLEEVGKISG
jgi:hypothetical protein